MVTFDQPKHPHVLYKDGDENIPDGIKDSNGQVVLSVCKVCGKAETELDEPCEARVASDQPPPGPMSALFDAWVDKRVRVKATQHTGIVKGVDPCPMRFAGSSHIKTGEYLYIVLDQPLPDGSRVEYAEPNGVEVL
jgi:hypothetical protein